MADMLFMHYGKVFLGAIQRLEDVAPGLTSAQLRKEQDRQKLSALREAVGLGHANKNVRHEALESPHVWYCDDGTNGRAVKNKREMKHESRPGVYRHTWQKR